MGLLMYNCREALDPKHVVDAVQRQQPSIAACECSEGRGALRVNYHYDEYSIGRFADERRRM